MQQLTHVESEIASQPGCWLAAAAAAERSAAILPRPGERLAVVGCGTSSYVAQAFASLRETADLGETDAFPASEMPDRRYDRVLAITRSGTTTEVLDLLRRLGGTVPTIAVTADPETPVVSLADHTVVLDFADERSVVQTRFATSTLALLRAHIGHDVTSLVRQAKQAVADDLPAGVVGWCSQFTFLGTGWTVGLANEGALKLREASLSWAESYPAMEYRHGPMSITDSRSLVWCLGPPPHGLAEEVREVGGLWVESELDAMAALIRVQRLAVALAHDSGLDPDHPRNLTRSIILDRS